MTTLRVDDPYRIVVLADGSELSCYAVVVATGVSVRKLEVPGAEQVTGAGVYYGAALTEAAHYRGSRRDRRRRRELGRAGRDVLLPLRAAGDDARARAVARRVDVALPGRSDRGHAQHRGPARDRGAARSRGPTARRPWSCAPASRARSRRSRPRRCSCSSAPGRAPSSATAWSRATRRASSSPASTWSATGARRPDGRPGACRRCSRPACPGIFAAGDVRHGSSKRVAAAVGEGAVAVQLVHQYLKTV